MSEPTPKPEVRSPETGIRADLPAPPTPSPTEAIAYRPISGWAIAALGAGCVFAVLVVISAVVALIQGAPLFFPMWLLIIPVIGIVMAWVGERHVRESEGTRTGAGLARTGFWISLVSGLIYGAYFFVTGYAVQAQADAFLRQPGEDSGFFPLLLESGDNPAKLNAAFLLTQPAASRGGKPESDLNMRLRYDTAPRDEESGPLSLFREGLLGRLFYKQLAKDAQIIPLEVMNWRYEQRSYKVQRKYRIKTKEVELDIIFSVASNEPESAGQTRKWYVNLKDPEVGQGIHSRTLTPLGQGVARLRGRAIDWLDKLALRLNDGESFAPIETVDRTNWQDLPISNEADRTARRALAHRVFAGADKKRLHLFRVYTKPDDPGKWEQVDGKMRFHLYFRMVAPSTPNTQEPAFVFEGVATVDSRAAINPEQFFENSPQPEWNLSGIVFTRASKMEEPKGPPG